MSAKRVQNRPHVNEICNDSVHMKRLMRKIVCLTRELQMAENNSQRELEERLRDSELHILRARPPPPTPALYSTDTLADADVCGNQSARRPSYVFVVSISTGNSFLFTLLPFSDIVRRRTVPTIRQTSDALMPHRNCWQPARKPGRPFVHRTATKPTSTRQPTQDRFTMQPLPSTIIRLCGNFCPLAHKRRSTRRPFSPTMSTTTPTHRSGCPAAH